MTDQSSNDDLDEVVARALVKRGELIPTTTEEVLETAPYEGELPRSLERYRSSPPAAPRPRERWWLLPYAGAVAVAAAAAALLIVGQDGEEIHGEHLGAPSGGPAASVPASASPLAIPAETCAGQCCAGASCKAAPSDMASCPTERTCIPCEGVDDGDRQYRLRMGNVASSSGQSAAAMAELDLCVSVGATPGSPWVCEPAYQPAATRPRGRFLAKASSVDQLVGGVSMELRPKGKSQVLAAWRSGIKVGPGSLCKGISVVLQNDKHEQIGTLSMFLERTYYVELARRDDRAALDNVASTIAFGERVPRFLTASGGVGWHVLALGPFDKPEADDLLRALRADPDMAALGGGVFIENGDDYDAH